LVGNVWICEKQEGVRASGKKHMIGRMASEGEGWREKGRDRGRGREGDREGEE